MIAARSLRSLGLALLFAACSRGEPVAPAPRTPPASTPARASTPPAAPAVAIPAEGKPGSPPKQPAPALDAAMLAAADAHFERAKEQWNDAQRARSSGDTEGFKSAILASWASCEQITAGLQAQNTWLEEADLSGWALPASYVALQGRFDEWDKLRSKVRKNKPSK